MHFGHSIWQIYNIYIKQPTPKFLVFDAKDGSYEKTLDTDSDIFYFCVDNENQRIITYYKDREIPLGYIDLADLPEDLTVN